ncbi:MAG: hypothetical protein JXA09_03915 [Anaerolineae bacterium]|nr:hypothetical protein [Anaerolineae bacterium]
MKTWTKWLACAGAALSALLLAWAVHTAAAQGPEVGPAGGAPPLLRSRISYQGVLEESGSAVTGARDMVFRLHQDSGCSAPIAEIPIAGVEVRDGRFSVALDVPHTIFDGRGLWLQVDVGGVAIGCQEVLAAPYALSLRPGAVIQGATYPAALNVVNEHSDGWALSAQGKSIGAYVYAADVSGPVYGLYGQASPTTGTAYGVYAEASPTGNGSITSGVYGRSYSNDGYGVAGHNYHRGVGVGAWSWDGNLIEAYDGDYPSGELRFYITQAGDVVADGNIITLSSVEGESAARALSAVQSPEAWIEDFGSAALSDGRAWVKIEPLYAQTVNLEAAYHVFLTPLGDCKGLYVATKAADGFEVRELGGGASDISFDYHVVAKRWGYEDVRLQEVVLPEPIATEGSREEGP